MTLGRTRAPCCCGGSSVPTRKEYSDAIAAGVILYRLAVWLLPIPIGWLVPLRWQSRTGNRLFGGGAED